MNESTSINLNVRKGLLLAAFTFIVLIAALAMRPAQADAAYNILDYKLTPSTVQAGGHPNFHYHVDPDASNADKTGGDDLKRVLMDFPAGLLGNPEAATTKCSASQFNSDKCPSASYIGSMKIVLRMKNTSITLNAPGSVYVLTPPSYGSAATIGFIVRPPGYRFIFLKTEVTGVVTVRSGTEGDYGLTLAVDNIPRTLTTTWGSSVSSTIADISVDINARANTSKSGPYFVFNPTRCTASPSKATLTSYNGVVNVKTDTFTNTGCTSVPFAPTSSYTVANTNSGATTGVSATFGIPTADATIQQSHIRSVQTDLPTGTGLDFPAIGNVPALCAEADLNNDACPAGSKIGTVSANVPFLPPVMTGDVYMLDRSTKVTFGYILRGNNGVKAPLKGEVLTVDADNNGTADFVRASTLDMPQAPWSTATINFSTPLVKNPVGNCGPKTIATKITGWSGAVVNRTNTYTTTNCTVDVIPPVVNITSPANNSTVNSASVQVNFTASDNSGAVSCNRVSGTYATLAIGPNTISVTCTDAAGNSTTQSVVVNYVVLDITPPNISSISPADNSSTAASSITLTYTATDNSGVAPTCTPSSGSVIPLSVGLNNITISCADGAGNTQTALVRVTRTTSPPVVVITSPANNSSSSTTPVNVAFTVNGASSIPAGTTCTVNGSSTTTPGTNPVAIVGGSNTVTVSCTNADGTDTESVTVNGAAPNVVITAPTLPSNTTASTTNVAFSVNGFASIPAGTTCSVNGAATSSATTNSVTLVLGANTITVSCTGPLGTGTVSGVVTRGDTPVAIITSPASGSTSAVSPINVSYTVNGGTTIPAGTTCTINGAATTTPNTNSRTLVAGSNTITVACTNTFGAGPANTITVTGITRTVAITSPADNTNTTASSINVAYTVDGASSIPAGTSCTINGSPSSSTTTNNVTLPATGANTITVTCTNAFGPSSSVITVFRGGVPVVAITAPANGSSSNSSPINVAYTVNGAASIPASTTCTVNGVASSSATTNSVAIVLGANTIPVSCTNSFGNSAPVSVTVNGIAPTVVITAPTAGTNTTAATTNVAYTVNGVASIPSGVACTVNGAASTSATTNSAALALGANTLTVSCGNSFGSDTKSVTVTRGIAPTATITSPANNSNALSSPINVTYTVTGTAPNTCTVNGAASSDPNTNSVALVGGANTITVACNNAFGSDTDSITVFLGAAPVVAITSPATNTNTTSGTINAAYTVNGSTTIAAGTTCTVNGSASTTPATNSVSLAIGANTITVICTNSFGSDTEFVVVNRGTAPVVTIASPVNGANTTVSPINVAYTVTGTPPTSCTVNGAASTTPATNSVSLVNGANAITVACSNDFGSDSKSVTVNLGVAPVVVITAPVNNSNTAASSTNAAFTVNGSSTIAAGTTCTVNAVPTTSTGTNPVALALGANTITVACSNPFGADSEAVVVTRGNVPVVAITSPADGANFTTSPINVAYTVNSAASIPAGTTCTVNGAASSSATTNSLALSNGANVITVSCSNVFGASLPATVNVSLGNTPAAAITSPTSGLNTTATSVNVVYTVNGLSTIPAGTTCTINGAPTTTPNTNSISLALGANAISVVCSNSFGAGNTATITVNRGTAPDVVITAPVNGATFTTSPINVSYTVTGSAPITCTVNGAASGSPSTNSVTIAAGSNTITVTCTNAFGSDTDTRTVAGIVPAVVITAPTDGTNTIATSINLAYTVNGAASIPAGTTCTVNGAASSSATTNSVSLAIGPNVIPVVCTNVFGASITQNVTVNRGNTPVAAITSPASGSTSTVSPINVSYTVNGLTTIPAGTTCTINGSATTTPNTNARTLVAGSNTISVVCTNAFGAGNVASITVTGVVPTVAITAPTGGPFVPGTTINIAYTVNGSTTIPAGTTCTINGSSSTSATTNPFTIPSGAFTITVVCTNVFGASAPATLVGSGVPVPVVAITSPGNGSTSTTTPINVTFTVNGATTIPAGTTCTINGTATTTPSTNSRPLVAGANTITVICTNSSGPSTPATITVSGVTPTVVLTAPANGTNTSATSINAAYTVNGSTTIPAGTTCTVNGSPSANGTTNSVALALGANTITVSCTNAFGASSTAPITVNRGNPPVALISSPANGSSSTVSPINVTYTVDGASTIPAGTTCTINGVATTTPNTNSRTLVAGANTITVVCTNQFGTGPSNSITVNGVAPTVALTAPATGTNTSATTINASYTVNGGSTIPAGTTCTVNGVASSSTSTNSVALVVGANTISASCTNAFGTTASASVTVTRGNPPVAAITSPANGSSSFTSPINVAYTVNGASTIPAGTTCTINGSATTTPSTNSRTIAVGANTISVVCTNVFGTGNTDSITVTGVAPTVLITAPANNSTTTASSTNVAYSINGGSTIPAGTTCTVNGTASTTPNTNSVNLPVIGNNNVTATCTSPLGTSSNSINVIRQNLVAIPNTTITTFPAPSSDTVGSRSVSFSTDTGTSFECRMNAQAFAPCSSAWTLPLSGAGIVQGENTYDVRAVNGAGPDASPARGYIWVDDRPFSATATATPQPNSLVPDVDTANDAGAHPNVTAQLDVEGFDDPQSVNVKFPDGLMGSLKAIPSIDRCTVSQADQGTCPVSSQVGTITGTAESPTDGLVTANGTLYLIDPAGLDSSYAAGIAAEFDTITGPVSGDLGDIRAKGGLKLTDQARNLTTEINDIPRQTTTGKPFHITTVALTVQGDTGGPTNPLITNPHFCWDGVEDFSARPNFSKFVGTGTGYYGGVSPEITVDYVVDNCGAVPFAPAIDLALTDPTAGASTGLNATVTLPTDNSTLRGIQVRLPSFISLNFPSFGVSADMCSGADDGSGSANNVSPDGTFPAYYVFDASSCPPQAQIGTATLNTPLLDGDITGNVYLIDKSPVPWIGIDVNPGIPGNPQGVNIGLIGFNATVNEIPGCTVSCQQVVQSTFTSVPDVPVSSVELNLGGIADRISVDGPTLNPNILNMAGANSNTCKNSGTFATAEFNPWSGTGLSVVNAPLLATGCNDPKINITAPVVPATGGRTVNVASGTTSSTFTYTVNGAASIPGGTTCSAFNTLTGATTASPTNSVAVPVSVGRNTITISCVNAFGTGTATRIVDRGIPSVFITSPSAASTNNTAAVNVAYGLTQNAVVASSTIPAGTTCTITNALTGTTQASTSLGTNSVPIIIGANLISVTCTNASGPGTSQTVTVTKNL